MKDPSDAFDNRAKLGRFHSLLFGIENASAKGDHVTALGLGLRLLSFLASESKTPEDDSYSRKILSQVHFDTASSRRATQCDREVLEQAKCPTGFRFPPSKPVDLERVKTSKHLLPVVAPSETLEPDRTPARLLPIEASKPSPSSGVLASDGRPDPADRESARIWCQSKLTNLYGGLSAKPAEKPWLPIMKPGSRFGRELLAPAQQLSNKVCSSRLYPSEPGNFFPPHGNEDDEATQKRGRNSNLSWPRQKKLKPDEIEDDVEDDVRGRPLNPYTAKEQEKLKPVQEDSDDDIQEIPRHFVTAGRKLAMDEAKKNSGAPNATGGYNSFGKRTLGLCRRGPASPFVPPVKRSGSAGPSSGTGSGPASRQQHNTEDGGPQDDSSRKCLEMLAGPDGELPIRIRNIEPKLLEHISNEIMDQDPKVRWDDIAGLEHAKKCVTEMVIWPLLRPDIFKGCRAPGKGLLLFGPPGTGKTMIGKAIAGEAKATFFSISASSLTSKWIGEGEKLVRALFGIASCRQPAVIFIDEIDSLLSQRKAEGEHETSRRLKTQFLIEMEGCGTGTEQVLLIGATNRPQELDEAARRRLSKRLHIPLPCTAARAWIVRRLLEKDGLLSLSDDEVATICASTQGYSGSDMKNLVKEASMGPLREALLSGKDISKISNDEMRPISLQDFISALQQVRASVSPNELGLYEDWNRQFGSLAV